MPTPFLRASALALLLATGFSAAHAAEPATDAAFQTAAATFQRARQGDDTALTLAVAQFNALSEAQPGDPLRLAYAGAAATLQARSTWLPWKKMRLADDGLARIDKALQLLTPAHDTQRVQGVPVALETKLTAAGTFVALPALFHRKERGERLLAEVMQHPDFATTPARFQEAARRIAAQVQP